MFIGIVEVYYLLFHFESFIFVNRLLFKMFIDNEGYSRGIGYLIFSERFIAVVHRLSVKTFIDNVGYSRGIEFVFRYF
jgi:hypothetical protein